MKSLLHDVLVKQGAIAEQERTTAQPQARPPASVSEYLRQQGLTAPRLSSWGEAGWNQIRNSTSDLQGIPYRMGGADRNGIDCSAYTQEVYSRNGLALPRTANEQYAATQRIRESELEPGDLIFLKGTQGKKTGATHVGVYIGNGKWTHASTHGVITEKFDNSYNRSHFLGYGTARHEPGKFRTKAAARIGRPASSSGSWTAQIGDVPAPDPRTTVTGISPVAMPSAKLEPLKGKPKWTDIVAQPTAVPPGALPPLAPTKRLGEKQKPVPWTELIEDKPAWNPVVNPNPYSISAAREEPPVSDAVPPAVNALLHMQDAGPFAEAYDKLPPEDKAELRNYMIRTAAVAAPTAALAAVFPEALVPRIASIAASKAPLAIRSLLIAGAASKAYDATSKRVGSRLISTIDNPASTTTPTNAITGALRGIHKHLLRRIAADAFFSGNADLAAKAQAKADAMPDAPGVDEAEQGRYSVLSGDWWRAMTGEYGAGLAQEAFGQVAQQFPEIAKGLLAGGLGAMTGGVAGGIMANSVAGAAGEFNVDQKLEFMGALAEAGVDLTKPQSILQAMANPDVMRKAREYSTRHAAGVTPVDIAFDAMAMALAARIPGGKSWLGKIARAVGAAGLSMAGESISEMSGLLAAGRDIRTPESIEEIAQEGVMGLVSGPIIAGTGATIGQIAHVPGQVAPQRLQETFAPEPEMELVPLQSGKFRVAFDGIESSEEFDDEAQANELGRTTQAHQVATLQRLLRMNKDFASATVTPVPGNPSDLLIESPRGQIIARAASEDDIVRVARENPQQLAESTGITSLDELSEEQIGFVLRNVTGFYQRAADGQPGVMYMRRNAGLSDVTHEYVHALRDMGILSESDINQLAAYGRKRWRTEVSNRGTREEQAAYTVQFSRQVREMPTTIRSIIDRVASALRVLTSRDARAGRKLADDIHSGYLPVGTQQPPATQEQTTAPVQEPVAQQVEDVEPEPVAQAPTIEPEVEPAPVKRRQPLLGQVNKSAILRDLQNNLEELKREELQIRQQQRQLSQRLPGRADEMASHYNAQLAAIERTRRQLRQAANEAIANLSVKGKSKPKQSRIQHSLEQNLLITLRAIRDLQERETLTPAQRTNLQVLEERAEHYRRQLDGTQESAPVARPVAPGPVEKLTADAAAAADTPAQIFRFATRQAPVDFDSGIANQQDRVYDDGAGGATEKHTYDVSQHVAHNGAASADKLSAPSPTSTSDDTGWDYDAPTPDIPLRHPGALFACRVTKSEPHPTIPGARRHELLIIAGNGQGRNDVVVASAPWDPATFGEDSPANQRAFAIHQAILQAISKQDRTGEIVSPVIVGGKLEGAVVLTLSEGCGRDAAIIAAVEAGVAPPEALLWLDSCHMDSCYVNFMKVAKNAHVFMTRVLAPARAAVDAGKPNALAVQNALFIANLVGVPLQPADLVKTPNMAYATRALQVQYGTETAQFIKFRDRVTNMTAQEREALWPAIIAKGLAYPWSPQEAAPAAVRSAAAVRSYFQSLHDSDFADLLKDMDVAFERGNQKGDWLHELVPLDGEEEGVWPVYARLFYERQHDLLKKGLIQESDLKVLTAVTTSWYVDIPTEILQKVAAEFKDRVVVQVTGPIDFKTWEGRLRLKGIQRLLDVGFDVRIRCITDEFRVAGDLMMSPDAVRLFFQWVLDNWRKYKLDYRNFMETPVHLDWQVTTHITPAKIAAVAQSMVEKWHIPLVDAMTLAPNAIRQRQQYAQGEYKRNVTRGEPNQATVGLTWDTVRAMRTSDGEPVCTEEEEAILRGVFGSGLTKVGEMRPIFDNDWHKIGEQRVEYVFPLRCCTTRKCTSCGASCMAMNADFWNDPVGALERATTEMQGETATDAAVRAHMSDLASRMEQPADLPEVLAGEKELPDERYEGGGDSYVTFRREQIKSAIANTGTFDATNPDIRFAVRESAQEDGENYFYHGTTYARLRRISREGLRPNETLKDPRTFLSGDQEYANSYASRKGLGSGVVVRVKRSAVKATPDERVTYPGDWTTESTIPPADLEVLQNDGWVPLLDATLIESEDTQTTRFAIRQSDQRPWEREIGKAVIRPPYINSVNLEYLDWDQVDDPQSFVHMMTEAAGHQTEAVRRVQTNIETEARAAALAVDLTPEAIGDLLGKPNTAATAEEVVAVAGIMMRLQAEAEAAGLRYAETGDVTHYAEMQLMQQRFQAAWLLADRQARRAGQALQAHQIIRRALAQQTPKAELVNILMRLQGDISQAQWDAIHAAGNDRQELARILRDATALQLQWGDKLHAFTYFNMLSSLSAHTRNAIGNLSHILLTEGFVKPLAAGIDAARGGDRTLYFKATAGARAARAAVDGVFFAELAMILGQAAKAGAHVFSHGYTEADAEKLDVQYHKDFRDLNIRGKRIVNPLNYPTRALLASDQAMRGIITWSQISEGCTTEAVNQLRRSGNRNPTAKEVAERALVIKQHLGDYPDIVARADKYADELLLTTKVADDLGRNLFRLVDTDVGGGFRPGKLIVPFKNVPLNMAKMGTRYTPLGMITLKGKSRYDQNIALSRMIIGTAVIAGTYALASAGLLELEDGQEDDTEGSRALRRASGRQPMSIRIGRQWISLQELGPLGPPLMGLAAAINHGDKSMIGEGIRGLWTGITNATFMSGLQTALQAINEGGYWADRMVGSTANQFLPASGLLGNIANATDRVGRETKRQPGDLPGGTYGKQILNKIPGARQKLLAPKLDPLGRPIPQQPTGWQVFVPAAGRTAPARDPVAEELIRLRVAPGYVGKTFAADKKTYGLSGEQWQEYQHEAGQAVYESLQRLFERPSYQAADSETQRDEIMSAVTKARTGVRPKYRALVVPGADVEMKTNEGRRRRRNPRSRQ